MKLRRKQKVGTQCCCCVVSFLFPLLILAHLLFFPLPFSPTCRFFLYTIAASLHACDLDIPPLLFFHDLVPESHGAYVRDFLPSLLFLPFFHFPFFYSGFVFVGDVGLGRRNIRLHMSACKGWRNKVPEFSTTLGLKNGLSSFLLFHLYSSAFLHSLRQRETRERERVINF